MRFSKLLNAVSRKALLSYRMRKGIINGLIALFSRSGLCLAKGIESLYLLLLFDRDRL